METLLVDQWLEFLRLHLESVRPKWALFEPTPSFYARLEEGNDSDLQAAGDEITRYLELGVSPSVTYEWGLRITPEAAGRIRISGGPRSQIQIPLFYAGKPHALGAILAHELTHEFLACESITCATEDELEQLTDLASIALGLGKLVLNGAITDLASSTREREILGCLSPQFKAYVDLESTAIR